MAGWGMGEAKRRAAGEGGTGYLPPIDVHVRSLAAEFVSGIAVTAPLLREPDLDDALDRQAGHLRAVMGGDAHHAFLWGLRDAATRMASARPSDGSRVGPPCRLFVIPLTGPMQGLESMMRGDALDRLRGTLLDSGALEPGAIVRISTVQVDDGEVAEAYPARLDAVTEVAMLSATDPRGFSPGMLDQAVSTAIRWRPVPGSRPDPMRRRPTANDWGHRGLVGIHVSPSLRDGRGIEGLASPDDGRFAVARDRNGRTLSETWREILREHRCVADAPCTFPEASAVLGVRHLTTSAQVLRRLAGVAPNQRVRSLHVHWGEDGLTCVMEHDGAFMGPVTVPARLWRGNDGMLRAALANLCEGGDAIQEVRDRHRLPRATVNTRDGFTWRQ